MRVGSITPIEFDGVIDLAALDIHPATAPLPASCVIFWGAGSPESAAMGTGKAFMGITHEFVNPNTPNAFGTLSSGWTPGESVQLYLNGVLAGTSVANADGVVAIGVNTGARFRLFHHRADWLDQRKGHRRSRPGRSDGPVCQA